MSEDFYKGKKIFITGADGFIGSHLVQELLSTGSRLSCLAYYNSWNDLGWLEDLSKEELNSIEIIRGDVRDPDLIRKAVSDVDHIFHLCSLIAIPYSYDAPISYVDTNISGVLNLLTAARDSNKIQSFLHVSTSEVYGSAQVVPINEDHPLVGQSPYSASKIGADKMVESFYLSFGLPVVTARPFNTFGPRQTARAVIPTIISQIISGNRSLKLGSLTPTRDFNYVTDTVKGMTAILKNEDLYGEVVNIGSGEEWSISETVNIICDLIGAEVDIVKDNQRIRPKDSEVDRLLADNSKLLKNTNWTREINFKEGLKKTINWIEKNIDKFDVQEYSK